MQIKIELMGVPLSEAGIDKQALIDNVDAEVQKLGNESGTEPRRKDYAAPDGAQGDHHVVEWLINLAQDPKMAQVYAQALLYAINRIVSAVKTPKSAEKATEDSVKKPADDAGEKEKEVASFSAMGKKIALPATTVAIQAFLKSLWK